jgi:hypothetical protein
MYLIVLLYYVHEYNVTVQQDWIDDIIWCMEYVFSLLLKALAAVNVVIIQRNLFKSMIGL